jgi:hypothetical protein
MQKAATRRNEVICMSLRHNETDRMNADSAARPRIAFFIAVHAFERQLKWLLKAIHNPHDIFVIHINRASSDEFVRAVNAITAGLPNVHYLARHKIIWGGWSIVEMTLAAMRFLCARSEPWTHFVNLSGQDYPLRPVSELRAFLSKAGETNFLSIRAIESQPYHIRRRLHWYCVEHAGKTRRLPIPNLRALCTPVEWYGDFWGILTRDYCEWLVEGEVSRRYQGALRHAKIPDEFFLQTLIMRSPFANTVVSDSRRYFKFLKTSTGPITITDEISDEVLRSDAFFARKFNEQVDASVLRRLAQRIGAECLAPVLPG